MDKKRLLNVLSLVTSRKFITLVLAVVAGFGLELPAEVQGAIIGLGSVAFILATAWEDAAKAGQALDDAEQGQ